MVSVAYLVSILGALIAISQAEDVANGKTERVEAKRFYRNGGLVWPAVGGCFNGLSVNYYSWINSWTSLIGGCYGYGILNGAYNNIFFAKAVDAHSVSRRAIALDADQLLSRRDSEQTVACANEKGVSNEFLKSDCITAAGQLAQKMVSSAIHGGCTLSLVTAKDRVVAKQLPAQVLEKAVDGILKACSDSTQAPKQVSTDSQEKDVALLLSKTITSNAS